MEITINPSKKRRKYNIEADSLLYFLVVQHYCIQNATNGCYENIFLLSTLLAIVEITDNNGYNG